MLELNTVCSGGNVPGGERPCDPHTPLVLRVSGDNVRTNYKKKEILGGISGGTAVSAEPKYFQRPCLAQSISRRLLTRRSHLETLCYQLVNH